MKNEKEALPAAINVFGVLPGQLWGTSLDKLVVLGAHWDTLNITGTASR